MGVGLAGFLVLGLVKFGMEFAETVRKSNHKKAENPWDDGYSGD